MTPINDLSLMTNQAAAASSVAVSAPDQQGAAQAQQTVAVVPDLPDQGAPVEDYDAEPPADWTDKAKADWHRLRESRASYKAQADANSGIAKRVEPFAHALDEVVAPAWNSFLGAQRPNAFEFDKLLAEANPVAREALFQYYSKGDQFVDYFAKLRYGVSGQELDTRAQARAAERPTVQTPAHTQPAQNTPGFSAEHLRQISTYLDPELADAILARTQAQPGTAQVQQPGTNGDDPARSEFEQWKAEKTQRDSRALTERQQAEAYETQELEQAHVSQFADHSRELIEQAGIPFLIVDKNGRSVMNPEFEEVLGYFATALEHDKKASTAFDDSKQVFTAKQRALVPSAAHLYRAEMDRVFRERKAKWFAPAQAARAAADATATAAANAKPVDAPQGQTVPVTGQAGPLPMIDRIKAAQSAARETYQKR